MAVAEVPQPSPLRRGLGAGREPAADKRHAGKGRRDERKRCWLGRRRRRWIERRRVERHPQVVQVESLGDTFVVTGLDGERIEGSIGGPAEESGDRTNLVNELRATAGQVDRDPQGLAFQSGCRVPSTTDRKSTRLNSSHTVIS